MVKNQGIIYAAKLDGKTDISILDDIFKVVGQLMLMPSKKITSATIYKLEYNLNFCDGVFSRYIVVHNNGNKSNDKFFSSQESATRFISKMKNKEKYNVKKIYFQIIKQTSLPDRISNSEQVLKEWNNLLFVPITISYEEFHIVAEEIVFADSNFM